MQTDQSTLAAMISSRICHDLISPIGAISNGLELVAMSEPASSGPEMELIQQSCDNATARIRFFRIAFGSASSVHTVSANDARLILEQNYLRTRIGVTWDVMVDLPRNVVQLAYLAVLCLEKALPQGGDITVTHNDGRVTVRAVGDVSRRDNHPWALLTSNAGFERTSLEPANVQFGLMSVLYENSEFAPKLEMTQTEVMLVLRYPSNASE